MEKMSTIEVFVRLGLFVLALCAIAFVALSVVFGFPKPAGATYQPSFHTEWKNEGHVKWGVCEAKAACGTTEGVQKGTQKQGCKLVQGQGSSECHLGAQRYVSVERSCEVETPACEEPKDYCDTLEGVQDEETYCPPVEEEEPPVVEQPKKDNDEKQSKCRAPGKVQGFRYMQINGDTRLRWTEKSSVKFMDLRTYGPDKKTILSEKRIVDDGEHVAPGVANWYRIRAVGNCGLSKWSALIN